MPAFWPTKTPQAARPIDATSRHRPRSAVTAIGHALAVGTQNADDPPRRQAATPACGCLGAQRPRQLRQIRQRRLQRACRFCLGRPRASRTSRAEQADTPTPALCVLSLRPRALHQMPLATARVSAHCMLRFAQGRKRDQATAQSPARHCRLSHLQGSITIFPPQNKRRALHTPKLLVINAPRQAGQTAGQRPSCRRRCRP